MTDQELLEKLTKREHEICPKCEQPKWGFAWCANQPCPSGYKSYEQSRRPAPKMTVEIRASHSLLANDA